MGGKYQGEVLSLYPVDSPSLSAWKFAKSQWQLFGKGLHHQWCKHYPSLVMETHYSKCHSVITQTTVLIGYFVISLQAQIGISQGGDWLKFPIWEWPRPPDLGYQVLSLQEGFSHGLKPIYICSTTHLRRGIKILEDFTPGRFQSCAFVKSCIFGENTNIINSYPSCMKLMNPSIWKDGAQPGLPNHILFIFLPIQEGGQKAVLIFQQVGPPKVEKLYNSNLD